MKGLIAIPHIFNPKGGSIYSSQTESKRIAKTEALKKTTIENLNRHSMHHWIHASLGKDKPIVTRRLTKKQGIELKIQIYTNINASLVKTLPSDERIEIINIETNDYVEIPKIASQKLLEQYEKYDILAYMEDDLLIEDPDFFHKISYLHQTLPKNYTVIPHRCEHIPGKGDVILSGDPDGGRPDLFWDTKERVQINWPLGYKEIYRATNPHSGCFFLSRQQAKDVLSLWESRSWASPFELSGPLEQAGSGRLIEILKVMKPIPEDYQFLMVRHLDNLWERHSFE